MVTGAAGNLANGVVRKFASEGATLALVDRHAEGMEKRAAEWGDLLGDYAIIEGDLGEPEAVQQVLQQVVERFGRIDALVHTVGGFAMGDPVHEADVSVYDKMMFLNARVLFITLGAVAKHMVDNQVEGSILAVLARSGLKGSKNAAAYAASKAAAQRIVESMALELKDHNIRVNGVMPSLIDTPPNRAEMPNADFSKWVTPEQLADAIAFLTSDAARAISGESLGVYNKA